MDTHLGDAFCREIVEMPYLSHAAVHLGAWFIGAAAKAGGFPLDLSLRQIEVGFTHEGTFIPGVGGRYPTIRQSLDTLKEEGILSWTDSGRPVTGKGSNTNLYTINL